MESKFEMGSTDALFERIEIDETGELKHVVMELIDLCRRASQLGVPMDELASCCTMAWYMGQSKEMEGVLRMIIESNGIDGDNIN